MTFLNVNFETQETTLQSFDRIADKISKDINLKINNESMLGEQLIKGQISVEDAREILGYKKNFA